MWPDLSNRQTGLTQQAIRCMVCGEVDETDQGRVMMRVWTGVVVLLWGLVYFVTEWWGRLPKTVALILFILLAVMVIGYPIYALARWSDRYLARAREARAQGKKTPD